MIEPLWERGVIAEESMGSAVVIFAHDLDVIFDSHIRLQPGYCSNFNSPSFTPTYTSVLTAHHL